MDYKKLLMTISNLDINELDVPKRFSNVYQQNTRWTVYLPTISQKKFHFYFTNDKQRKLIQACLTADMLKRIHSNNRLFLHMNYPFQTLPLFVQQSLQKYLPNCSTEFELNVQSRKQIRSKYQCIYDCKTIQPTNEETFKVVRQCKYGQKKTRLSKTFSNVEDAVKYNDRLFKVLQERFNYNEQYKTRMLTHDLDQLGITIDGMRELMTKVKTGN